MGKLTKETFIGDIPASGQTEPGVYLFAQPSSGKFYVGSTVNMYHRFIVHTSALERGEHGNRKLQRAFNKDPRFIVQFQPIPDRERHGDIIKKLREAEQTVIDRFQGNPNLLNIAKDTVAIGKGYSPTEETRAKIAQSLRGRSVSVETRQRRSESMLGVKHTDERRHNVALGRNKLSVKVGDKLYLNTREAARAMGFKGHSAITHRCESDKFPEFSFVPTDETHFKTQIPGDSNQ